MSDNGMTRREFMEGSALGAAAAFGAPAVLSARSPSDVVGLGIIGVGMRGSTLLREAVTIPNTQMRAVCDLYGPRRDRAAGVINNPALKMGIDYRQVLDNKDIDGIIVATPDHWHAKMAVDAAAAGKDIYLEKCMTRTLEQAKAVVRAVKQHKRVLQLGHGARSRPVQAQAREVCRSGILGHVTLVRLSNFQNSVDGTWKYPIPPDAAADAVHWERFLGDTPKKPWDPNRFFRWRWFWEYGTGIAGDLMSHQWDATNNALSMGIPETSVATGGIYQWKDGREVPDVWNVIFDYPAKGLAINYTGDFATRHLGREQTICGKNATMVVDWMGGLSVYREGVEPPDPAMTPDAARRERPAPGERPPRQRPPEQRRRAPEPIATYAADQLPEMTGHIQNFVDCMRSRARTRCNEDDGFEETVACLMSVAAFEQRRLVRWDPVKQAIV